MVNINDQRPLAELAGQVRTHLEYLRELGVESAFELAGLPGMEVKPKVAVEPSAAQHRELNARAVVAELPRRSAESRAEPPIRPPARLADLPRLGAPRTDRRTVATGDRPAAAAATRRTPPSIVPHALFSVDAVSEELPSNGETMAAIQDSVGNCTLCPLHEGRTHIVHTEGDPTSRLMFVGEAPGADEDAQGRPFVGRAGQLLNKIIEAIGFRRDEILIGNINRCRPPQNRAPLPNEVAACKPFLLREIGAARPEVIVVLGNTAMRNLLGTKEGITKVRGVFQDFHGIKVMPTFHPAYLLRDPSKKRETWEDLKKVRDYLLKQSD